jgi:transcriptional regulator with XRE-family HTH domain
MGRTVDEIIATLPKRRRARIDARYRELKDEVESLAALRKAAGKAQADLATFLKIKQPSVSKIEKQTDMYLSTLRSYVEAIGGELDLIVRLPTRRAVRLNRLGDVLDGSAKGKSQPRAARARPAKRSHRRAGGAV